MIKIEFLSVQRKQQLFWLGNLLFLGLLVGLIFILPSKKSTSKVDTNEPVSHAAAVQPASSAPVVTEVPVEPIQAHWENVSLDLTETVKASYSNVGVDENDLKAILAIVQDDSLANFISDGKLNYLITSTTAFTELSLPANFTENLILTRESDQYTISLNPNEPEVRLKTASGIIKNSFAKDAAKAKLSAKQVKEFMTIFANDINFKKETKKGDYFSAIYETIYKDDELIKTGDIVAAEYITKGKVYRAIRYKDINGQVSYYTPSGANLQRAFSRNPVPSATVSSHFAANRVDPVSLQFSRPHKGTDFKAPRGAPIKATGDGKIIFVGMKNGYGNTIVIQHNGKYQTLYAHMDHFEKGIHTGMFVKEGQLIGYVGSTGRVTGPHLHYEFIVNGAHDNPLTAIFPRAKAVTATCRAKFAEKAQKLMEILAPLKPENLLLAKNQNNP